MSPLVLTYQRPVLGQYAPFAKPVPRQMTGGHLVESPSAVGDRIVGVGMIICAVALAALILRGVVVL